MMGGMLRGRGARERGRGGFEERMFSGKKKLGRCWIVLFAYSTPSAYGVITHSPMGVCDRYLICAIQGHFAGEDLGTSQRVTISVHVLGELLFAEIYSATEKAFAGLYYRIVITGRINNTPILCAKLPANLIGGLHLNNL